MALIHISPDMTAGDLVVGVGTLLLALFTFTLARKAGREVKVSEEQVRLARESIEAQETARREGRREDAAIALNQAMRAAGRDVPTGTLDRRTALAGIDQGSQVLQEEWDLSRGYLQDVPSITRAVGSLDALLFLAASDCRTIDDTVEQNFFPLAAGFEDLHDALAAFINGKEAPQPRLPDSQDLIQLAYPEGKDLGLEGVLRHLQGA